MLVLLIAYDNNDEIVGSYFDDSKNAFTNVLHEQESLVETCILAPTEKCTHSFIEKTLPTINSKPFIFIAYTHGNEESLICNKRQFISPDNSFHFKNAIFYSTACLTGKKLGHDLISKNCKTFIGFKEKSEAFLCDPHKEMSINCNNHALIHFITTTRSIGESFASMKSYYNKTIDKLEELHDVFFAGQLVKDRNSLIILGDKEINRNDL